MRKKEITAKEYGTIHYWLRSNFGVASRCEGKKCSGKSQNYGWALKKDKRYEKVKENFEMLCKSCHSKQDITEDGKNRIAQAMRRKFEGKCQKCEEPFISARNRKFCEKCNYEIALQKTREWRTENRQKAKESNINWKKNNMEAFRNYQAKYWREHYSPNRK